MLCPPWLPVAPKYPIPQGVLRDLLILGPRFPQVLEKSFAKCTTCTWAALTLGAVLGSVVLKVGRIWCR